VTSLTRKQVKLAKEAQHASEEARDITVTTSDVNDLNRLTSFPETGLTPETFEV